MDNNIINELEQLPFEQALKQLEEIVAKMESGNLPLDDMIANFEKGNALSKICGNKLSSLQQKIEVLVKEDANSGEWQNFDASSQRQNQATAATPQAPSTSQPPSPSPNTRGDNLPF